MIVMTLLFSLFRVFGRCLYYTLHIGHKASPFPLS